MPRSAGQLHDAAKLSGGSTRPEGFEGEFRISSFVRGVIARST